MKILANGLKVNQRELVYADMVKNYTDKNVYLAVTPSEAANYATRQAIEDSSSAVILEITLNAMQVQKLRADEDAMHWFKYLPKNAQTSFYERNPIVGEIWGDFDVHFGHLNHGDGKFELAWLFDNSGNNGINEFKVHAIKIFKKHGINAVGEKLSKLENHLYTELLRIYIASNVIAGIKSAGALAYPGNIAPGAITIKQQWSLKGSKIPANRTTKQYQDAIDIQQKTVKN